MSERTPDSELSEAVSAGDVEAARALLDAGADVRYVRPHGYTALVDAMHGRDVIRDDRLLPLLRLLIDRGADLNAASTYGESALSVASRVGRFDAVRLLLDAGAAPEPLGWSPLHRAVALGTVEDVRAQIERGADLTARDGWERTPWLLSLQTGDIAKAEVILAAGANLADRGRCGQTALVYPIDSGHTEMVRWLLARGADPNATDNYGDTALIDAAGRGAAECVRLLLDAGADVYHRGHTDTAIGAARTLDVARMLVAAGADINDINNRVRAELTRVPRDGSIACTAAEYHAAKYRVFGTANPEGMNFPFWKAMVRGGACAYDARAKFEEVGPDGKAVWCFDRFGKSLTELPDGRIIEIGGEHEDSYDPDFCIYNDVVVLGPGDQIEIYGYPKEVFPPTDFHTASLVGGRIIIVGCLGYPDDRRPGHTPVYSLDLADYRISEMPTAGEAPGWVFKHEADVTPDGGIIIWGGEVIEERDGERRYRRNVEEFALDTRSGAWRRLTSRNWLQFSIRQEDRGLFVLEQRPAREQLFPRGVEYTVEPCEDWNRIRFVVRGVPVSVSVEVSDIEIIVQGELPEKLAGRIAEEVRGNAEAAIQRRCVLERV